MTAGEKFSIGDRVRQTDEWLRHNHYSPSHPKRTGVVVGFGRRPHLVGIIHDGGRTRHAYSMNFWERVRVGGKRGRPDVSTHRVFTAFALLNRPLTTRDLRTHTGLKKTTLEIVLKRLIAAGSVVRDPAEWKGSNGKYTYARSESAARSDEPSTVDAGSPTPDYVGVTIRA